MEQSATRKYPRLDVTFPVEFWEGSKKHESQVKSIGGGGMFVAAPDSPSAGEILRIKFRPAKNAALIKAAARVCYSVPGQGMGLEFTDISERNRQTLLRWICTLQVEKREHPRAPLVTQVECSQLTMLAYARDISIGGMFVQTKEVVPFGSPVTLRFYLDENREIVSARAEVVYCVEKFGLGVRFTRIAPADVARIQAYVLGRMTDAPQARKATAA